MQTYRFKLFLLAGILALQMGAAFGTKWPAEKVSISGETSTNLQDLIDNEGISGGDKWSMLRFCAGGGKAINWNSNDSCWWATCGKYKWSEEYGDSSDYNVATTAGGNSWTMTCTGNGTATGSPDEQVVCLSSGYTVEMYKTADLMLAWDNTCLGGRVYLPAGVYHIGGCGQDADGNANNCPWLQRDPTHEQHRLQMLGGIKLIGAGAQLTDADIYGIDLSKTMIVVDEGRGGATGDSDVGGDNIGLDRRSITSGGGENYQQCLTEQDAEATLVCTNNQSVKGRVSVARYARALSFSGSCAVGDSSCNVTNTDTAGVCENDPRLRCTLDAGNRVAPGDNGDCDVVGDGSACLGMADMIAADLAAGIEVWGFMSFGTCQYGDGALGVSDGICDDSWDSVPVRISAVTGAAEANPRGLTFEYPGGFPTSRTYLNPTFETAAGLVIVDPDLYFNHTGGYEDVGFMAANWPGRDHDGDGLYASDDPTNDAQDCDATGGSNPGEDPGCDGTEILSSGSGYGGGFDRISVQHAGGGREYSVIDGLVGSPHAHLYNSEMFALREVMTDASGWQYRGNVWRDSNCGSNACLIVGFTNNFAMRYDSMYRLNGTAIISFSKGRGPSIRDIEIFNSVATNAIFQIRAGAGIDIAGVRGHGNVGALFHITPYANHTIFNNNFQDMIFEGHRLYHAVTSRPYGLIVITDYNGHATYVGGRYRTTSFSRIHANVGGASDSPCLLFFEGGSGDDSDADNGAARTIDDYRNELSFDTLSLHHTSSTNICGVCLGNAAAGSNQCSERLGDEHDFSGPRPRWKNIVIGKSYGMEIDSAEIDDGNDRVNETGHSFESGDGPFQVSKNGNGLTAGTLYWANKYSANAFSIHATVEDALAGTNKVPLTTGVNDILVAYHYTEKIADWLYATMPARDVPDCDTLSHGTVVAIHDDTTAAGTCDDSAGGADGVLDGGGTYTSICACDPAGTGTWTAIP